MVGRSAEALKLMVVGVDTCSVSDALETAAVPAHELAGIAADDPGRRQLPRSIPPLPNAVRLLEDVEPRALPGRLVELAEEAGETRIGLYVIDIGGSALRFAAGGGDWPVELPITQALGPELPRGRMGDVQRDVDAFVPGAVAVPLWLHGRAVAVLICDGDPAEGLEPFARQAAMAVELADRYTDVFSTPRRRRRTTAASEIQENLLPPRVAHVGGAHLAGGIVPAYEVGGDWYDYAENPDGVWLAVADAAGKGPQAAGASTIALGAYRAARRAQLNLVEAAWMIDEAVKDLNDDGNFVTAVLAHWRRDASVMRWARFGHPLPVVVHADGGVEVVGAARANLPLGLLRDDAIKIESAPLRPGERFVLTSDGVWERRLRDRSLFGLEGLAAALSAAVDSSAAAAASAVAHAVVHAAHEPPRDDATVLVLAPDHT